MIQTEWAYLAGIIDGEGCISARRTEDRYYASLIIGQRDRRLLEWIQERLDGHIYTNNRGAHVWHAPPATLRDILICCYPYLVLKGEQAKLAMRLCQRPGKPAQKRLHLALQQAKRRAA